MGGAVLESVRIQPVKEGTAVYISHLDFMRCLTRAIKRAGLPVWYTEGFNPHPHLVFALPLSLGFASDTELLDVRLTEPLNHEETARRLNEQLPAGVRVTAVYTPERDFREIAAARYDVKVECDWTPEAVQAVLAEEQLPMEKKSKSGMRTVNIREYMLHVTVEPTSDGVALNALLKAGSEQNLNPELLVMALSARLGEPKYAAYRRRMLYDANLRELK